MELNGESWTSVDHVSKCACMPLTCLMIQAADTSFAAAYVVHLSVR